MTYHYVVVVANHIGPNEKYHPPLSAEPQCDDKLRKLREVRDAELDQARHIKEQELAQIRADRELQLREIRRTGTEAIDYIQTTRRQQITELTTKRQQCEMEDDQETCRAGWDVKIEAKRVQNE